MSEVSSIFDPVAIASHTMHPGSTISITDRRQSFGFETRLNFGAGSELPIRQSSTSRPKKWNRSSVISFNQSRAARCSSVKLAATQQIVTAFKPAA